MRGHLIGQGREPDVPDPLIDPDRGAWWYPDVVLDIAGLVDRAGAGQRERPGANRVRGGGQLVPVGDPLGHRHPPGATGHVDVSHQVLDHQRVHR